MSEQFKSALIRALIISVVTGIGTALTTWATTDETKTILIAGGTAFVTTSSHASEVRALTTPSETGAARSTKAM